jgi:double-stranded uracil-DNA glycosylase
MDKLLHSFDPVVQANTSLLVCGSLPGVRSLAASRYYAHPQNQFWRLMGAVIDQPLPELAYEDRLAAILAAGAGLWDVVASGRRQGSLDAAIRIHQTHDLPGLVATLPHLRGVAFNGGTAARIGTRLLAGSGLDLVQLPSSSPAYTLSFEEKCRSWLALRAYL